MHNLAITLQKAGHVVTGSDDEIYEPAYSRLLRYKLLPAAMGWFPDRIHSGLDLVILGMHARADNEELARAHNLNIPVQSFPEFVYEHSRDKRRVVVAGSHGKTTTTSMILHVLNALNLDFDYLVGAQLEGFETMVKLTQAPLIVLEGDEYLSSAVDKVPKIWHYRPHLTVLTGIAWDHMNVFPTWDDYIAAFTGFLERIPEDGQVWYDGTDEVLQELMLPFQKTLETKQYLPFESRNVAGVIEILLENQWIPLQIFGEHNLKNLKAAYLICRELQVTDEDFAKAIPLFTGASKRLQKLVSRESTTWFQDFAHAPSKVRATTMAVKDLHSDRRLTAVVELHTYSSLNKEFLPQYHQSLAAADLAVVFYSPHTLEMKKMPPLRPDDIKAAFDRQDLIVMHDPQILEEWLMGQDWTNHNLLLMSSGTFNGMNLSGLKERLKSQYKFD